MGSDSKWTSKQNKLFEDALASFDKDSADRWQHLARAVGGKTVEDVKSHYQKLVTDIDHIETGKVPVPNYKSYAENGNCSYNMMNEQEQR
ncbi:protein RADIALIS-like 3 [Dorcoceras hygrometricum]|uniref:Protein RADIALIS-like 3 n=1 Tax=Dorcoceras hygrometricum TaxID=472368 RepID=A0A2Z7AM48_9LAMI|nr:protein RADIALIS-like 3 [Dorcoceras hygrometricum]